MSDPSVVEQALTETLCEIIGQARKEWERELEVLRAERRALLEAMRADLAEHRLATAPAAKSKEKAR